MIEFFKNIAKNPRIKALLTIFKNLVNIGTSAVAIIFALPSVFLSLVLPKKLVELLNKFVLWLSKVGNFLDDIDK